MLTDQINDLIVAFTEMRKQPGLDKKSINKTIGRLEEAALWSKEIVTPALAGDRISLDSTAPSPTGICTCPHGTLSKACPAHGGNAKAI